MESFCTVMATVSAESKVRTTSWIRLKDIKTYASFYIILKYVGKRELKSIKQSNYYHCITCKNDLIAGKITKQTIKVNFKIRKYSYSNKT